jgi:hypothetical protein
MSKSRLSGGEAVAANRRFSVVSGWDVSGIVLNPLSPPTIAHCGESFTESHCNVTTYGVESGIESHFGAHPAQIFCVNLSSDSLRQVASKMVDACGIVKRHQGLNAKRSRG